MQVPEHVVSLYVATCGQNGPGLGTDEKEIILLVYVIIESATGQIVGTKQLLVRPAGCLVKDRTISSSSETSNSALSPILNCSSIATTTTTATLNDINNSNINLSNNNNNNNNFKNINNNINSTTTAIANAIATNTNASTNTINGGTALNNNDVSNTNTIITTSTQTPTPILTVASTTTTTILLENNNQLELPIAAAQAAGKPFSEAIEEFDEYLRSLSLLDVDNFKLITDGQLPLRQCLHREACAKDIELPSYYNRFSDLRKEFMQFRSGDLSRALVPMKDIKKILQMPTLPLPQSIGEMMKDLNLTSTDDMDFYIRESRDMVTVIQAMINGGHKFSANEIVNLVLEPGICSIDDEIDGNCIVRARGLPWQSSDQDIAKFFRGLNVAKGGVALCLSPLGRRNGEALVRFISQEHRDMALKRHKHHIGNRYIEVYPATGEDFLAIAGGASNEAQAFLSKGAQVIIRMRGLPYDCTAKQVLDFFTTGEKPCHVLDGVEGVLFVKKPDGRATGDAFVLFANEVDAPKALSRHRESIGQRYIELFRSTTAEVQQVLNRSMDPKTYESNHQPPLIAQLPTVQLSLLPQHLITSGTTKNCIRLRGLPYEALVEHILHFLDDFAKHIIYQGVHMVINAQGQPSGEAFIQMDSEESARLCAQRKHNQFMVFGKKYRYIEVFQCSGDDMNMVLNGGLQSPVTPHHPHLPGAGKQPSLLSPGASVISGAFGPFAAFGPATPMLASPHRTPHHHAAHHAHHPHPHHAHPHPAAAFYPAPLVYWPYPSPPVSPTTYFSPPTHSPTHVATNLTAQHQPLFPVDFIPAAPGNYAAQPSPMSPPSITIPPTQTSGGLILTPSKTQALSLVPQPQKQYSPLPAAPTAVPAVTTQQAAYHSKISLIQQHPIAAAAAITPMPANHTQSNNIYTHYNNATAITTMATVAAATGATPINQAAIPTQTLLTIDTSSSTATTTSQHMAKCLKATVAQSPSIQTPRSTTPIAAAASNLVGVVATATPVAVATTNSVSGQTLLQQQCVELYIS